VAAPSFASVVKVTPEHRYPQAVLTQDLLALWQRHHPHLNASRVKTLHQATQVEFRHLVVPKEAYRELATFSQRNEVWQKEALHLAEAASRQALATAGLAPSDVDLILFTTVTGLATPSIDARLVNRLGLRPNIKRLPLFGLGCVAGVAGTARLFDALSAYPQHTALLVAVELCSLTVQHDDVSVANLIAAGLFGDGGAAAVIRGGAIETKGPRILGSASAFYPDTEGVMGWSFRDTGFQVVLSADVPRMVSAHLKGNVDSFLGQQGLTRQDITHWVAHTGGPKVLEAFEAALELPPQALRRSWESLRQVGNLSSASVLHVLSALLHEDIAKPGEYGLMVAMGPGFCAELVLLQW
jgi:alkylresorcinol/alkylpyrone synthase